MTISQKCHCRKYRNTSTTSNPPKKGISINRCEQVLIHTRLLSPQIFEFQLSHNLIRRDYSAEHFASSIPPAPTPSPPGPLTPRVRGRRFHRGGGDVSAWEQRSHLAEWRADMTRWPRYDVTEPSSCSLPVLIPEADKALSGKAGAAAPPPLLSCFWQDAPRNEMPPPPACEGCCVCKENTVGVCLADLPGPKVQMAVMV